MKKLIQLSILFSLVFIFIMALLYYGFWFYTQDRAQRLRSNNMFYNVDETPPGPQLQVDPYGDLKKKFDADNDQLNSYGWSNSSTKQAHIPIERAKYYFLKQQGNL